MGNERVRSFNLGIIVFDSCFETTTHMVHIPTHLDLVFAPNSLPELSVGLVLREWGLGAFDNNSKVSRPATCFINLPT